MKNVKDTSWDQWMHFAGLDWSKDHHDVVVVDRNGVVVLELRIEDTAEGWSQLCKKLQPLAPVAVAVETSHGGGVERLLQMGVAVYPVQPKAAQRYRDRKAPDTPRRDLTGTISMRTIPLSVPTGGQEY